jgi:DNA adenine methylase
MTASRVTDLRQPLKWHGGKHYLAKTILDLMPDHVHYVEPFFGGGSVLLQKPCEGVSEVVNDVHLELTNFWRVLQNPEAFAEFRQIVSLIPFSQIEWESAKKRVEERIATWEARFAGDSETLEDEPPSVPRAVDFFVVARQSRAGKMDSFATMSRNRTRRSMNEQAASWIGAVEGLPAVAERLRRVVIFCKDAVKLIKSEDGPNTLFYLDPPYMHETRITTADYHFEMSVAQHERLLDVLVACEGKILLSGYPSELYNRRLADWRIVDVAIDNKASSAKNKPRMIERIWMNY